MLVGERLSVEGGETQSGQSEGRTSSGSAQEMRSACDPVRRGNAVPAGLISAQPRPAAAPPEGAAALPPGDPQQPACPRCGLAVPDSGRSPGLSELQGSRSTVHSGGGGGGGGGGGRRTGRRKGSMAGTPRTPATPADPCFRLLLACLWCRCSVLLLALLDALCCSSCCCCAAAAAAACARCCSAVQEVPAEELNCHAHCHAVLFESCCEPTECLEFCLDCCDVCHRS